VWAAYGGDALMEHDRDFVGQAHLAILAMNDQGALRQVQIVQALAQDFGAGADGADDQLDDGQIAELLGIAAVEAGEKTTFTPWALMTRIPRRAIDAVR
jgi:hypothetical protein